MLFMIYLFQGKAARCFVNFQDKGKVWRKANLNLKVSRRNNANAGQTMQRQNTLLSVYPIDTVCNPQNPPSNEEILDEC